jgi:hypothetical protein
LPLIVATLTCLQRHDAPYDGARLDPLPLATLLIATALQANSISSVLETVAAAIPQPDIKKPNGRQQKHAVGHLRKADYR